MLGSLGTRITLLGIALGLVIGLLAGQAILESVSPVEPEYSAENAKVKSVEYSFRVVPILEVKHYRMGQLIWSYTKEGDPLTGNFMSFVIGNFLGQRYNPGGPTTVANTGNFTHTNALNTEYIGGGSLDVQGLYIAIGSGNKPFEPGDFNLNNTLQSKGELSLSFGRSFNQTHYIASVSASFGSTTQTLNVNEIGLLLKRTVQHYYLIARDVLPSTISLAPGDQLIVTYRFVFEEPVVYNFAELISRYILAWGTYNNGSTGNFKDKTGATWPGIDLYTDSTGGDTIKEVVYAELYQANGTPSFDMTWYGPQPGDTLLWSGSPTIGFSINSTTACIDVIVNVGVPPGTTGDYLAVFLKTDANVTSGALEKDFALFYTVFNPPLQGGNQYTIDLRICFG